MRNLKFVIATLVVVFAFTSCTETLNSTISVAEAATIMPGNYKVYFYDESLGAGMYEGYTFQLFDNGTMTATVGELTYEGEWEILPTNESDLYDYELTFNISGNPEMEALAHDWWVEDITEVTLFLKDDAGTPDIHLIKI